MIHELKGEKFGHLTVVEEARTNDNRKGWLCECECGGVIVARTNCLTSGKYISCGCAMGANNKQEKTKIVNNNNASDKDLEYWKRKAEFYEEKFIKMREDNIRLREYIRNLATKETIDKKDKKEYSPEQEIEQLFQDKINNSEGFSSI